MALQDDLKKMLTCSYCSNLYENPIILPCGETICRKDLVDLHMKSNDDANKFKHFTCPYCSYLHEEPVTGFHEDRNLKNIIDFHMKEITSHKCESYRAAKVNMTKLNDAYKEYNNLLQMPHLYLDKQFLKLKKEIEKNREENKSIVDRHYDGLLLKLKEFEGECLEHAKEIPNKLETDAELSSLPTRLNGWVNELNLNKGDTQKCEVVSFDIRRIENELTIKLNELKTSLMMNRTVCFERRLIDDKSNCMSDLKIKDLKTVKSNENLRMLRRSDSHPNQLDQVKSGPNNEDPLESTTNLPPNFQPLFCRRRSSAAKLEIPSNKIENLFVAMVDHQTKTINDLTYAKGDLIYINEFNRRNESAWFGIIYKKHDNSSINLNDKSNCGLVQPENVVKLPTLDRERWYFGQLKRGDAEALLERDSNPTGAFLIRASEKFEDLNHFYSLSLKDPKHDIKHYRILNNVDQTGLTFCLNPKVAFKTLHELIEYHSKKSDGLCTVLTRPCSKEIEHL